MLPAGVIERIDRENQVVHVNRTKNEIKSAPWHHEERFEDETYRSELGLLQLRRMRVDDRQEHR